jgi:hypothetical protein
LIQEQSWLASVKKLMIEKEWCDAQAQELYLEAEQLALQSNWYFKQIPILEQNDIKWLAKGYWLTAQSLMAKATAKEQTADQMKSLATQSHLEALQQKVLHKEKQIRDLEEGLKTMPLEVEEDEVVQPTDLQTNLKKGCIFPDKVVQPTDLQTNLEKGCIFPSWESKPTYGQRTGIEMTKHTTGQVKTESRVWAPLPTQDMEVKLEEQMTEGITFPDEIPITKAPPSMPEKAKESDALIVDLQDISESNV